MVEIAELTAQQTIKLSPEISAHFRPTDRTIVWIEGDTLLLKHITPPPVTAIVEQASEAEPMSLEEINEMVHDVRREQRGAARLFLL
jgi:hypothetical protein